MYKRTSGYRRREFGWRALPVGSLLTLLALFAMTGCDTEQNQGWPWSTSEDSAAVRAELASWRGVFDPSSSLSDTLALNLNLGLLFPDSTSPNGDTLYKFAHVLRAWYKPGTMLHADSIMFGVTADTGIMTDTFCDVIRYRDSIALCTLCVEYDSLWKVGYRPETIIDTLRTPPETSVTWHSNSYELIGFPTSQQDSKEFAWVVSRRMFLRKNGSEYALAKANGFRAALPTADVAPSITSVILVRTGQTDTFKFTPTPGGRQVGNLWPVDTLYTIGAAERFTIAMNASTPSETTAERNRFYVTLAGRRTDITAGAKRGEGVVSFAAMDTGYQHIYVEVLPWSNLLYPASAYAGTFWAIPVRVTP